ncbi:hypothetical protein J2X31_002319 [Flavobacterium arsenatis]|uniref:Anti-sigma factor n=1 Tax=Flavobacterium arsenatis TaxID=1484332 RepID=A0ABU1TRA6_9FLAO|nr:hypothetical protein [Flavobacterium arsenatis]MDR6968302.1 hypothetical protein [Flavobacterium arsenatis]
MELDKLEILLEKYFEGETSIAEENQLKEYFSSSNVAQHLKQYKPLFGYFSASKQQEFTQEVPLVSNNQTKKRTTTWLSIAASVTVLLGAGTFTYFNYDNTQSQELGTYDDPEVAFRETQKALSLLSQNVNVGMESVQYIQEYETAKNKVFN